MSTLHLLNAPICHTPDIRYTTTRISRETALKLAAIAASKGKLNSAIGHDGTAPRLADGTLAGSSLTLDRAVANVVAWGAADLVGAVRAATTAPADLLGRPDLGRIEPGARADLAALGADGRCTATWLGGRQVA